MQWARFFLRVVFRNGISAVRLPRRFFGGLVAAGPVGASRLGNSSALPGVVT